MAKIGSMIPLHTISCEIHSALFRVTLKLSTVQWDEASLKLAFYWEQGEYEMSLHSLYPLFLMGGQGKI